MFAVRGLIACNASSVRLLGSVGATWFGRSIAVRRYSEELERIFQVLDRCNLGELGEFLDKHPKAVNYRGGDKTTPLHYLAGADPWAGIRLPVCPEPPKKFVQLLLERGSDKEALNHREQSPLHMAASVGYFGIVEELISKKAMVKPEMFEAALFRTVNFDPYFRTEEALWLEKGVDLIEEGPRLLSSLIHSISWRTKEGENSLNPLYSDKSRIVSEHCQFIGKKLEFLLEIGADPDVLFNGKTALQALFQRLDPSWSGRLEDRILREAVPVIANYCKDLTVCDENGWSYLHYAVHRGHTAFAKELIEKGLSLYQADKQGLMPYDLAFTNFSQGMYSALGIDADSIHMTPEDVVKIMQKLPVKSKNRYWASYEPVEYYSMGRQFSTGFFDSSVRSCNPLERQVASLYRYEEGKSAMVRALETEDLKKVKELVSKGWNVHIENECAAFKKGQSFYSTLQAIWKDLKNDLLARQIITALISEPTSDITLASEFMAALYHGEEGNVYLLLDLGLTPDSIELVSGKKFNTFMWHWFCNHFDDERGWYESEFYPAACRIIKRLMDKGYLEK